MYNREHLKNDNVLMRNQMSVRKIKKSSGIA
jgi:hypothetical protein